MEFKTRLEAKPMQKKEIPMEKKIWLACRSAVLMLGFLALIAGLPFASEMQEDKTIERIGPEKTRQLVQSGQALLVCAYDDDACSAKLLDGALLRSELDARLPTLPKSQTIIFYCG